MTSSKQDPLRWQVAYHEAGHAVVAHSFGLIVESLRLSGASGRLRGILAASSDLRAEVVHGTGLLTGLSR